MIQPFSKDQFKGVLFPHKLVLFTKPQQSSHQVEKGRHWAKEAKGADLTRKLKFGYDCWHVEMTGRTNIRNP